MGFESIKSYTHLYLFYLHYTEDTTTCYYYYYYYYYYTDWMASFHSMQCTQR